MDPIAAQERPKDLESGTKILPEVYEELRRLASCKLASESPGQTLQPTALVHEAWLRMSASGRRLWTSKDEFIAAAAQSMRRILVDNVRYKCRPSHGGGAESVSWDNVELAVPLPKEELLALDEALDELAALDPVAANLVTLRFFGGLTHAEAAQHLGINRSAADRLWLFARAWLFKRIRMQEDPGPQTPRPETGKPQAGNEAPPCPT